MRTTTLVVLSLAGAVALAPQSAAAQSRSGLRVRVWAGAVGRYVLNDNDTFDSTGFGTVGLKVNGSAVGFGADAEYKLGRWIGIDAGAGYSQLDVQFTSTNDPGNTQSHNFAILPLFLAVNLHLVSTEAVDIWAGPQIGYVVFPNSLSYPVSGSGTFAYGPTNVFSKKGFDIGADIALSKRVMLNLAVRWLDADADGNDHLTIDPTFVTAGFTFRP